MEEKERIGRIGKNQDPFGLFFGLCTSQEGARDVTCSLA